jgi:hypothetical protein
MSLLLNGAKTLTVAGTEMQCVEIYTGEAYSLPIEFTTSAGIAINCAGWTLTPTAKFYRGKVEYPNSTTATVSGLTLNNPQPDIYGLSYYSDLTADFTDAATGKAYLYIPTTLANGYQGSPSQEPTPLPQLTDTDSVIVIVTIQIERNDDTTNKLVTNRLPIAFVVRYQ